MPEGMSPLRRLAALAVGAAAVALPVAVAAPAARRRRPAGRPHRGGQLVQAWPEAAGGRAPEAAEPLSWVQPAPGTPSASPRTTSRTSPPAPRCGSRSAPPVSDPAPAAGRRRRPHAVVDRTVVAAAARPSSPTRPPRLTDRVNVVLRRHVGDRAPRRTRARLVDAVDGPVAGFWSGQTAGAVAARRHRLATWTPPAAGLHVAHLGVGGRGRGRLQRRAPGGTCSCTSPPARRLRLRLRPGRGRVRVGSGGELYVRDTLPALLAHELGHNLGLGHSSGEQCDARGRHRLLPVRPYRDYYDVMGASWEQLGTLDAAQAARLGVLPAGQQQALDAAGPGGTVTLAPLVRPVRHPRRWS